MSKSICRIVCGFALLVALGLGACGGGNDKPAADVSAKGDTSKDAAAKDDSADASSSGDAKGAVKIPAEVCDVVKAADVGAILDETVDPKPGPQGSCSYNGETAASLYPTIYLKDPKLFDITGIGEPITIDGNKGYVSAVADSPKVQHGVLIAKGIYIDVVVNTADLPGTKPTIEKLLALTAKSL